MNSFSFSKSILTSVSVALAVAVGVIVPSDSKIDRDYEAPSHVICFLPEDLGELSRRKPLRDRRPDDVFKIK
ncbi:hypothetical protein MJO29_001057 [Puccinia striiformis f. sp. tritici]|nr:hypothetical protein MJO29_001057 [Puccinia striiformis f. sp. tritici]